MNRTSMLQRLREEPSPWDVLVIGGGATGLGSALDAATRGYRTLLLEQGDFAQGTSSRSTKLIHGGLRYLQQGDLAMVRESLRERGLLLRNARHLVRPLEFVIPHEAWWHRPYYGLGLKIYDVLAGPWGLGGSRHLDRPEMSQRMPTLDSERLRGGTLFLDGQFDDARLALALAQSVADHRGVVLNGIKVTALCRSGDLIDGVYARDVDTGQELDIRARVVINATGVYSDEIRKMAEKSADDLLSVSQGAHLVLDGDFLPGRTALMVPRTDDGRVLFAIPWLGRVLVGTTETSMKSIVSEPRPLQEELDFLLHHVGCYLVRPPQTGDVLSAFAGLRPLIRSHAGRLTARLSRKHFLEISRSGLVTITGGKWTTYRQMAEEAIDHAAEVARLPKVRCMTRDLRLHGWSEETAGDFCEYGSDAAEVAQCCRQDVGGDLRLHPRLPYRQGEVRWAARHTMPRTLEDMLSRRLRALMLNARASMEIAPSVAAMMAAEQSRSPAWEQEQIDLFHRLARGYLVS